MPEHESNGAAPPGALVRGYFVPFIEPGTAAPVSTSEVMGWLRRDSKLLLIGALVGLLSGIMLGAVTPRTYEVRVVAAPVKESGGGGALSGLAAQFGGLASIAGVDLSQLGNAAEAIAVLRSRSLLASYITEKNLLPTLFASRWNAKDNRWDLHFWQDEPTAGDAVDLFDRKIRFVEDDRRTGIVTLMIRWRDPEEAAKWANDLMLRANRRLQSESIEQSRRNIAYLQSELERNSIVGVRDSIFRLIEGEIRRGMIANGRPDFAFRVLDPAVQPPASQAVAPKRLLMAIAGMFLGLMVGSSAAVWRGVSRGRRRAV